MDEKARVTQIYLDEVLALPSNFLGAATTALPSSSRLSQLNNNTTTQLSTPPPPIPHPHDSQTKRIFLLYPPRATRPHSCVCPLSRTSSLLVRDPSSALSQPRDKHVAHDELLRKHALPGRQHSATAVAAALSSRQHICDVSNAAPLHHHHPRSSQ